MIDPAAIGAPALGLLAMGTYALGSSTPGLADWSIDPPVILVLGFGFLYWLSNRRTVAPASPTGRSTRR